jgi:hypothetical protein
MPAAVDSPIEGRFQQRYVSHSFIYKCPSMQPVQPTTGHNSLLFLAVFDAACSVTHLPSPGEHYERNLRAQGCLQDQQAPSRWLSWRGQLSKPKFGDCLDQPPQETPT